MNTLVKNILSNGIENCEITITSNYIFDNNQKVYIEKEFNNKKIMTKFFIYIKFKIIKIKNEIR